MIDISNKVFGILAIIIIAIMQLYAWYSGHNGAVFAFTSLCIGSITGASLGVAINLKRTVKEYEEEK